MALTKRKRFEIFKRDGFRCIYCGATPVDRPLHVDHVEPASKGGTDGPENLVTSCSDCNQGKAAVLLSEKKLKSKTSDADRDHAAQILQYLKIQREVARARADLVHEVLVYWTEHGNGGYPAAARAHIPGWLREFQFSDIIRAIDIVTGRELSATNELKYICGIFRNWRATGVR